MTKNRKFALYHTLRRIAAPRLVVLRSTYSLIRLTLNPFNDDNIIINIDKYFDTKTSGRSTDTAASRWSGFVRHDVFVAARGCPVRYHRIRKRLSIIIVLLICYSTIFSWILRYNRHFTFNVCHVTDSDTSLEVRLRLVFVSSVIPTPNII